MPVLVGGMNCRLGKSKFRSLKIILDSGSSSSILLGKHRENMHKKNTKPVCWSTQGGEFQTKKK